ncbi:hypothetical protein [Streptomyces sp. NPDC056883]|uniref:hypothetical protein n=1 Tax=Streptomyces sp. NPDC056883 TaxID=3345959 RepID=UPI0036A1AC19
MNRTKRAATAATAVAAIALGAAGCGTTDGVAGGAGTATATTTASASASASVAASPRPEGTGPLPRGVVRTDLDTSSAAAGAPANDPDWLRMNENAPADSVTSCAVSHKGFGTGSQPVSPARFEATLRELGKRGWKQRGEPEQHKDKSGVVIVSKVRLEQRGWGLVAEFMGLPDGGTIGLTAFDDACMKAHGKDAGPVG